MTSDAAQTSGLALEGGKGTSQSSARSSRLSDRPRPYLLL